MSCVAINGLLVYTESNGKFKRISSSAVSKSPRDASCLAVVRFNNTKQVQSFIVSYIGYRHCVQLNAALLSLA